MKPNFFAPFRTILVLFCFSLAPLPAEQFGLFEYALVEGAIEITGYPRKATGSVEIPSEIDGKPVTTIGDFAFFGCRSLTSITIPNSVTIIGISAFNGCSSLTSVTIPNSVTTIGGVAFYHCGSLTSVTIPEGVTTISKSAFGSCSSLTSITIPEGVTTIEQGAFNSCSSLTSVTIPEGVTTIEQEAFSHCSSLISIVVASGNPNYVSEDGILFNSTKTTLLQCPGGKAGAYAIPSSVTTIGVGAFSGCSRLTSVTIPSSVTTINHVAFTRCSSLTSLTIPDSVTTIGHEVFRDCRSLTSITLPDGITTINRFAFFDCSSLTSVTIPDSVTTIGNSAFTGCSSLTSVTFPDGITTIDGSAFRGCRSLTSAVFLGNAPARFGDDVFLKTAPNFTIYYLSSRMGFTMPSWNGYPTMIDDEANHALWFLRHDLPNDTVLRDNPVLFMAYALDLDPNVNLSTSLPAPDIDTLTGYMSLTFHATSPGITYTVETSTDMKNWTTEGILLSGIGETGEDGRRTAAVERNAPKRFMRIVVEN